MKFYQHLAIVFFSLPLLMACQQEALNTKTQSDMDNAMNVLQAADGSLYVLECLSEVGVEAKEACKFNPQSREMARGAARGSWSSFAWMYLAFNMWKPRCQSPSNIGQYWGLPNNWYNYFGYRQRDFRPYDRCSRCYGYGYGYDYGDSGSCLRRSGCVTVQQPDTIIDASPDETIINTSGGSNTVNDEITIDVD